MSGHGEKQSRLQELAITASLACSTFDAAAEQAGVAPATLRRWLTEDDFQQRYRGARRQVLEQAVSGLQQAARVAVATLRAIAEDATAPPGARVSAARTVLDQAFRGMEVLDLAARIEHLERGQVDGQNGGLE
jgi:hypothetical protein